jgi:hypothetical protein
MATRYEERPRERERVTEEELRLEPMLSDRDFEKLYGTRAWLRDRVRLAPVFAALFIAFATQIFLTAFGIWVGVITAPVPADGAIPIGVAAGLGAWTVAATWLALLLGGWYTAHMSGVAGRLDSVLNGVALWGLFITTGVVLGGITGLLGLGGLANIAVGAASAVDLLQALNLAALPTITAEQADAIRAAVSNAALFIWIGTGVGAGFAILGGWLGARSRRVSARPQVPRER